MIAVAGFGGRLGERPAAIDTARPTVGPATRIIPSPSIRQLVVLSDPPPPPAAVAGIPLWVRGHAAPDVRQVLVVLVDGEARIARQTVRPSPRGTFSVVFTLVPPRPEMQLTVIAVGRDSGADAVSTTRRTVLVSALAATGAAAPRPSLGEDGVLGSRGVDLAALRPTAAPGPAAQEPRPAGPAPAGAVAAPAGPLQR